MEQENKEAKVVPMSSNFVGELTDLVEKSWDAANSGNDATNEMWSPEIKAFLDATTLKSLFFSEDWVYIAVDLVANKISSQPLRVMKTVVQGGEEITEPFMDHPLNALLEQPNQWQDYSQWMYNTVVELVLMGNAVMWHAPRTGQIMTLSTENIMMDFDGKGAVKSYTITAANDDNGGIHLTRVQTFDAKQVAHVRRPNPSSLLWGLSPFIPGRKSILFNRYSTDYLNAFYQKQATPGLALSLDRTVNEDVALRQLRSFEMAYQGRKNMRRTLILPKGVTATTLTHSLSDQKLIDHINQNRETILGLLKIPKHELGLQTAGSLGSEEFKIALRNFWESTLIPSMKFIEGTLSKFFQKELGEGAFFQFDLSGVEALKDDLMKKAETAIKMLAAGLSVNEVRQDVWKKETIEAPDADLPHVMVITRASANPFGRPAPGALPPKEEEEPQAAEVEEETLALTSGRTKMTFTPKMEELRAVMVKQLMDEEERTIGELSKKAVDLLVDMTSTAVDTVLDSAKSIVYRSTKAEKDKNKDLARRIEKALAGKYEEEWQNTIAKTLKQSVDVGYDQQLEFVFNQAARTEVEVLRARDSNKRRASLSARGLESFSSISKTHTDRIISEIAKGQEAGESITAIMRRVADSLGTPGQLAGKAETIARTETLTAVSIGQAAAMKNAAEVIPGLKKGWMSAGDSRVRDSHAAVNGEVIDADEKFSNGLAHPRDTNAGDAGEVINCRCSLILIPPGEKLEIP
jgi:HK97 family phage portal protein